MVDVVATNQTIMVVGGGISGLTAAIEAAECGKQVILIEKNPSVGGRITHTLAEYLFLHMQVIRPNLTHVQSTSNSWPHYLLNAGKGDVFIIFDVRRYENNTLKLAEMAHARGAQIILFTDQWRSPVPQLATHSFSSRIVVPSAWDSAATTMLLVETMIAAVQNLHWDGMKGRMEELEEMFDQTRLFRKFT